MRVVAVLYGGPSLEHDISVASGIQVLEHLDRRRYRPFPTLIERDGSWWVNGNRFDGPLDGARAMLDEGCRVVFPALHGPFGEDGTIQGFLETLKIPFVGSGHAGAALSADKIRTKRLLAYAGVEGAPDLTVPPASRAQVESALGYPVVVKNPFQGSTLGLRLVSNAQEYDHAVSELGADCAELLVERREEGREFTVPVIEEPDGSPRCLPLVEIVAKDGFFDYDEKYAEDGAREIVPAPLEEPLAGVMRERALLAHRLLGLRGMSRTDFILRPSGEPVYLETNSIPGLTARSLLPQSAAADGIPFTELLTRLVETALR